jgi:translation initiation factor 1
MDLQEQLKKLFPDHQVSNEPEETNEVEHELYVQKEPMICKFEKKKRETYNNNCWL